MSVRRPSSARRSSSVPTLLVERGLFAEGFSRVGAMDEVGRGSLGGPVSCGLVVVGPEVAAAPSELRDSKLLRAPVREALVPRVGEWALDYAVGHAVAAEIDLYGLTAALRLAGLRALSRLSSPPDVIVLDGSHDWLTGATRPSLLAPDYPDVVVPPVRTMVKADLRCASVAAASVLAKVERDALMVALAQRYADYGWESNKGYASASHLAALRRLGPCDEHRRSWNLPVVFPADAASDASTPQTPSEASGKWHATG